MKGIIGTIAVAAFIALLVGSITGDYKGPVNAAIAFVVGYATAKFTESERY